MLENLWLGLSLLAQPDCIIAILLGAFCGLLVGILPGLSPASGVALLIPFTFTMEPLPGLVMLAALYSISHYGGAITAITVNTPGDPANAATVIDGYAMTQKGLSGKALRVSLYASVIGGIISAFLAIAFSVPLARFALKFGPPEYFALALFGLTIVATLVGKNWVKGLIAVLFGLLLNCIGIDQFTGFPRFSFGSTDLYSGLSFTPVLIGLFAISEVFHCFAEREGTKKAQENLGKQLPTFKEFRGLIPTILRSSLIGTVIGAIPAAGATIAAFVGYNEAKRFSKNPGQFGKGSLEGVAGPEAACDAAVKGSFIPLLTLGIPGSATTAIVLGALMIHGLVPGPLLFTEHPDIVYGLFMTFPVVSLILLLVGVALTRLLIKAVNMPTGFIAPLILAIAFIGAYAEGNSMFNVYIALAFGIIGYLFDKIKIPLAPIILGLILGTLVETNFRRALTISDGNWGIFVQSTISVVFLILTVLSIVYPIIRERRNKTAEVNG